MNFRTVLNKEWMVKPLNPECISNLIHTAFREENLSFYGPEKECPVRVSGVGELFVFCQSYFK